MEQNDAEMSRGMSQVLNNFVPGNLFPYGPEGFSMKVDDWKIDMMENIDRGRIANRISGKVDEYQNANQSPWNEIDETRIKVYKPKELDDEQNDTYPRVHGELFPKTMVCRNCGAVRYYGDPKRLAQTRGECQRCESGELFQIQFVLVHECGAVSNIKPEECNKPGHNEEDIYLRRGDPDDITTFSFYCGVCGNDTGTLSGHCTGCGDYIQEATPLESGTVYYSQREVMVEIPLVGIENRSIDYDEGWARILMHTHLGKLDLTADGVTLETVAQRESISEDDLASINDKLRDDDVPDELAEEIIDTLADSKSTLPGRIEVEKKNKQFVDIPGDKSRFSQIAHELFTFIRATQGYHGPQQDLRGVKRHPTSRNISEFINDIDFQRKYNQVLNYRDQLDDIKVADAWVVDNFPLLSIVYGYTRGDVKASNVNLNAFDIGTPDELAVLGDRSPSEAIILEVDRQEIVEWLLEAGKLAGEDAPDLSDEVEVKSWFLETIDTTELQNPFTDIEDSMTREIYTLLHTMSHALMNTASNQCGLDSDSISEMLLPTVPAIVLYAKSTEHFALGGMFTLFKTRLDKWIREAKAHASRCIYDPACLKGEDEAACHACMHVSEFTCDFYNNALDRRMLVGDGNNPPPFWNNLDNEF